jgi:hypothetical protein
VAAWIASAIWCFVLALWDGERPHAGWARAGFAACALGLLTKGLIGVALPGLVIGAGCWPRASGARSSTCPGSAAWRCSSPSPCPGSGWPASASRACGATCLACSSSRATPAAASTTSTGGGSTRPPALLLFPWAFLAAWDGWPGCGAGRAGASADSAERRLAVLCWIWLAAIVLFFSIPRSKLIGYILPVLPPLALLAALGWQRRAGGAPARRALVCRRLAAGRRAAGGHHAGRAAHRGRQAQRRRGAELACRAAPGDPIYALGGYPMDLAFTAQTPAAPAPGAGLGAPAPRPATPARELFEAGDFEPAAARILLQPAALARAVGSPAPGCWPRATWPPPAPAAGRLAAGVRRPAWSLYRSAAPSAKGPETSQHEGLPGCHAHGGKQRQP